MKPDTLTIIKAFADGYVANIPTEDLFVGYDEWHSVTINDDESWDINFHMCGEPNTLHVVAHPECTGADGFRETDMSQWVKVTDFRRELPAETEVVEHYEKGDK